MAQTFSGTQHLVAPAVATAAPPVSVSIWITTSGGQGRKFFSLGNPTVSQDVFGLYTDVSGPSNRLAWYNSNSAPGASGQTLSSNAMNVVGGWNHCGAVVYSTSSRAVFLNGVKATGAGAIGNPAGLTTTVISGRPTDFSSGISGQAAHCGIWTRALSDTEMMYLAAGGHPRAVKGCVSYWKIASGASPVPDEIGSNDMVAGGPPAAGTTNPDVQTVLIGAAFANQALTVGTAMAALNASSSGIAPAFDDVSAAFTSALYELGTSSLITTTNGAGTAVREFIVAALGTLAAGQYVKITAGGAPTRILAINAAANTVLVATDQTFATGAQVFQVAVSTIAIAGLAMTANVYGGTPVAASTFASCLFRAVNNSNAAIVGDSNLLNFTITGGGGGGGAGLLLPAGVFSGGFVGG